MANIKVYNMQAKETGALELNDALFQMDYNEPLIHQAVITRLANERQGTKSSLTRSEVRGGGKKPFRQKGTGNARQAFSYYRSLYGRLHTCGLCSLRTCRTWTRL